MPNNESEITAAPVSGQAAPAGVLTAPLGRLLAPLARLCLANGVTYAMVDELVRLAFVQEVNALHPGAPAHGTVSRVSAATGINRREVTRLLNTDSAARSTKPLLANEVFARWTTDPAYRDQDGAPLELKRQGAPPSFETLAHSVTRDVHPRCILEDLVRLGLARHLEENDTVSLTRNAFVPRTDAGQMLDLLGDNVGDHLDAAVGNVLQSGTNSLEQAIFADELSAESVEALRPLIKEQWQALCEAMVPKIAAMIEDDRGAGRKQDQRIRIGLYSYSTGTEPPAAQAVPVISQPEPVCTEEELK